MSAVWGCLLYSGYLSPCMAYVSVVPLIIHCAASAPGSSGRKRPMTLMRSLASKRPPPRTSAASLMLVQERARRDGQRKRPNSKNSSKTARSLVACQY